MNQLGSLELTWLGSYSGQPLHSIEPDVFCYQCGQHVKFQNQDGDVVAVFTFPGRGAGPMAVHKLHKVFAVAEVALNPNLYVYGYPSLLQLAELKGGSSTEIQAVEFSLHQYLLSLSGIPEFELVVWDYEKQEQLVSVAVSQELCTSMTFNPANWQHLCLTFTSAMTLLRIEQNNEGFIIRAWDVKLPCEDPPELEAPPEKTCSKYHQISASVSAIAGVGYELSDLINDINITRVVPQSHAWTPAGDIWVGGDKGHLLKVNSESLTAEVVLYPEDIPIDDERYHYPPSPATTQPPQPSTRIPLYTNSVFSDRDMLKVHSPDWLGCLTLHQMGLFAVRQNKVLRLDLSGGSVKVETVCTLPSPPSSLAFSHDYHHLIVGTVQGRLSQMSVMDMGDQPSLQTLTDAQHGKLVGLGILATDIGICVSVRDNGVLQVWRLDTGVNMSSLSIPEQMQLWEGAKPELGRGGRARWRMGKACCMSCSPLLPLVVVGSLSGHVYFVDVSQLLSPRLVHREYLYTMPVNTVKFDEDGLYLFTGGDDGNVFVLDSRPSHRFTPLGYVGASGSVRHLSVLTKDGTVSVAAAVSTSNLKDVPACSLVLRFILTKDIFTEGLSQHQNSRRQFLDTSVYKVTLNLQMTFQGLTLVPDGHLLVVSWLTGEVFTFLLNPPMINASEQLNQILHSIHIAPGCHQLPGSDLALCPHHQWLVSYGKDGALVLRLVDRVESGVLLVQSFPHHSGGIQCVACTNNGQYLLTGGHSGHLCCYKWNWCSVGADKARSLVHREVGERDLRRVELLRGQDRSLLSMDTWTLAACKSTSLLEADREYKESLKRQKEEARQRGEIFTSPPATPDLVCTWLQARQFEAVQKEKIKYAATKRKLRGELLSLRKQVGALLQANAEAPEIERLEKREFSVDMEEMCRLQLEEESELGKARFETLFKNVANEYLAKQIQKECWDSMQVPGRTLKSFDKDIMVINFPLMAPCIQFLTKLDTVHKQRNIELREKMARIQEVELNSNAMSTTTSIALLDVEDEDSVRGPDTFSGSLLSIFGVESDFFYSQFDFHLRHMRVKQIVMVQDAIFRIKEKFNTLFDDVFLRKAADIARIKDKNKRIAEIFVSLNRGDSVWQPAFGVREKPEQLFVVDANEIQAEKVLSPAEQEQVEREMKAQEARRLLALEDNQRQRGLHHMMGGVLELRREDELKKNVPIPPFMQEKEEADWTEEEQKVAKDYHQKVKDLEVERDKFRKQLESELRRLQQDIEAIKVSFDEVVQELFSQKMSTTLVVLQEELKIQRIRNTLLQEEELLSWYRDLQRELESVIKFKEETEAVVVESQGQVEAVRADYEVLLAEDRLFDKGFRREFQDVSPNMVDQLQRHYKKRPRVVKPKVPDHDAHDPNPWSEALMQAAAPATSPLCGVHELDQQHGEHVDPALWDRLCQYRAAKMDTENKTKAKAAFLADMQAYVQRRHQEADDAQKRYDAVMDSLLKAKEDMEMFELNAEVQLLMKQSQIEVCPPPNSFIPDYKNCVLVHRRLVERLNENIQHLGEQKIDFMEKGKDINRGIMHLQWDHQKMAMQMQDLQEKLKDIQFTKVSREVQVYLSEPDYEAKKARDMATLEETLTMNTKYQAKALEERRGMMNKLKKEVQERDKVFAERNRALPELNVFYNECKHISHVVVAQTSDAVVGTGRRYQQILQRHRLVDVARSQASQIVALRKELGRLEQKSYPMF